MHVSPLTPRPALSDADLRAVGPRIRMMQPQLTRTEARVVELVLGSRDFTEGTSLQIVAAAADVSEAMVVKVAKKLGYEGFRDFRASLAAYNRLPIVDLHQELSPDDSIATIMQKVFRTAIQALEETLAILSAGDIDRAAQLLHGARTRDFYGLGGSAQIARDAAHKFLRIGVRVSVQDDAHMMAMSAALLGRGDLVVAFSHSGETAAVIDAVRIARAAGASVVVVTNHGGSSLAGLADICLCSTAQGSPLTGENAAARVAQLNILDVLFVAVAQRSPDSALANLERTIDAVRRKSATQRR
jgi:DNA-binding MurR/RpiR family transcriptional regulator